MKQSISRRVFLCSSAGAAAAAVMTGAPSDRVRVGIIGLGRRGGLHALGFARTPNVEVCSLCDLKANKLSRFAGIIARRGRTAPATSDVYAKLLDRGDLDAVAIALPEPARAAAVRDALQAGKHLLLDPNGMLGLKESANFDREARARGLVVDLSQDYAPVRRYMESAGFESAGFACVTGRLVIGGSRQSLTAQTFSGLDLARRALGCTLPSEVVAFELGTFSSAASFHFAVDAGGSKSLHWEVLRQPLLPALSGRNLISISAEGASGARFGEWCLPVESGALFQPGRERFQAFANAIKVRDSSLVLTPLSEGRLTIALMLLAAVSARVGRPVSFDPVHEAFIGEDVALQHMMS